jgi:hypothetical protein
MEGLSFVMAVVLFFGGAVAASRLMDARGWGRLTGTGALEYDL